MYKPQVTYIRIKYLKPPKSTVGGGVFGYGQIGTNELIFKYANQFFKR